MNFLEIVKGNSELLGAISSFLGAFFAFIFFILGQICIDSNKERSRRIADLEFIIQRLVFQLRVFDANGKVVKAIQKEEEPITIFLQKMELPALNSDFYSKFQNEEFISLIIRIDGLKNRIKFFNDLIVEMSSFSKIAMLEKREDEFKRTMTKNLNLIKKNAKDILVVSRSIEKEIKIVVEEAHFCLWYERKYFWKKLHFILRQKFNSDYKKSVKKKYIDKYDKKAKHKKN